jgi:hypothetical protein
MIVVISRAYKFVAVARQLVTARCVMWVRMMQLNTKLGTRRIQGVKTTAAGCSIIAMLISAASVAAEAATLTTPSYEVTITENCPEGDVACKDVTCSAVNRKTKKAMHLKGHRIVHNCRDDQGDGPGKTPCHPVGYEFRNGSTVYEVGDDGTLTVRRQTEVLLKEAGKWDSR